MKLRFMTMPLIFTILTSMADAASADANRGPHPVESNGASGESPASSLDRRFSEAMARMDERLLAFLEPAALVCEGDFVTGGIETCVARFDGSRPADGEPGD